MWILVTLLAIAAVAAGAMDARAESIKMPTPAFAAGPPPAACPGESQPQIGANSLERGREPARTIAFCATGLFERPLYRSLAAAGLPPSVRDEVIDALAATMSLLRDVADGDGFYVRYEQAFSGEQPLGLGRLLWAEIQSRTRGTIAVHRFRSNDGGERFWTAAGKSATAPPMRQPLAEIKVSSGFGLRPDPFGEPSGKSLGMGGPLESPVDKKAAETADTAAPAKEEPKKEIKPAKRRRSTMAFSGLGNTGDFVNGDRAIGREVFVEAAPAAPEKPTEETKADPTPAPVARKLFLHAGVDLVAPIGTPIYAAGDGTVVGAGPNGPYGNWIRIDHPGRVTTIYGHLSRFDPDIKVGAEVREGQLIGYVGSTGRSTGAHLHFEVWRNGQAVDPLSSPEMKPPVLNWSELQRFKAQVGKALVQRGQEVADGSLQGE